MKTNVVITTHAQVRFSERTPFEERHYQFIANYAWNKAERSSDEKTLAVSAVLERYTADRDLRLNKAGHFVAKVHGGFIFLFNVGDDTVVRLITIFEADERMFERQIKSAIVNML